MNILKYTIFVVILVLITSITFSQQSLSIKVIDKTSGKSVSNAHLLLGNSYIEITDMHGELILHPKVYPVVFAVSCVGYISEEFTIDSPKSGTVIIKLEADNVILEEVVISDKPSYPIFEDKILSILDYAFPHQGILMLIYRNRLKKSFISFEYPVGNDLFEIPCPEKPVELFTDCFGYVHLVGRDSVYQIYATKDTLRYYPAIDKSTFNKKLKAYKEFGYDKLFYSHKSADGFSEYHSYIDVIKKKREIFRILNNETAMASYYDRREAKFMALAGPIWSSQGGSRYSNTLLADSLFWKVPIFSDLFLKDSKVMILDITHGLLEIYDMHLSHQRTLDVDLHTDNSKRILDNLFKAFISNPEGRWAKEVIQDPVTSKVYIINEKPGNKKLVELDTQTGDLIEKARIYHGYAENIKVYNGSLYYTYSGYERVPRRKLYRQPL